jgi:hypothetical protein
VGQPQLGWMIVYALGLLGAVLLSVAAAATAQRAEPF